MPPRSKLLPPGPPPGRPETSAPVPETRRRSARAASLRHEVRARARTPARRGAAPRPRDARPRVAARVAPTWRRRAWVARAGLPEVPGAARVEAQPPPRAARAEATPRAFASPRRA